MNTATEADFVSQIAQHVPFLRRYARALTGSQGSGDAYAAAALEAILHDRSVVDDGVGPRVGLFKVLHSIWKSATLEDPDDTQQGALEKAAHVHLSKLTAGTREALLLHTIEEFNREDVAKIMGTDADEVDELIDIAHREMADSIAGRVLIIEDEALIAMDLEGLISDLGHQVTGVARTRDGAVKLGTADRPDLILADIQLADNSSGIDAVNDLLGQFGDLPVIFVTAFPERLLTGARPEPAFLITKPYTQEQVRSAVTQAMFFSSTETLHGVS